MSRTPHHQSGFTLIEIMIVVMIIAILSAIAIPQYQQYVTRSKLTEATSNLSSARASMEQYYQDNRAYTCPSATPPAPKPPTMNYFQFVCTLAPDSNGIANQAYTLTANGNTGTSVAGFSFSIDNLNNKTSNAPVGGVQSCWVNSTKGGC